MTQEREEIRTIRQIVSNINDKLEKMKNKSEDILSSDDADDFFKNFLTICTGSEEISRGEAQQTFFDKIKNWYKKFLGENRNLNLEEFKFITEEAKLLTEAICNKKDYATIKNIFLTWKKGFNYNYKVKFNRDIDEIKTELSNIEKSLRILDSSAFHSSFKPEPSSFRKKIDFSKFSTPSVSSIEKLATPVKNEPKTSEPIITPVAAPITPEKKQSSLPSKEKTISNISNYLQSLGFNNDERLRNSINNVIDSNRTQELLNLINSQDIKDIKMFLGL